LGLHIRDNVLANAAAITGCKITQHIPYPYTIFIHITFKNTADSANNSCCKKAVKEAY
jgi:hypothetical protein